MGRRLLLSLACFAVVLGACAPSPESGTDAEPSTPADSTVAPTATGSPTPAPTAAASLTWEALATGYRQPVLVLPGPGARTYVVEQAGRVVLLEDDGADAEVWLDLTDRVTAGGERGLLGLAFALDGASVVAHYSGRGGATTIERFTVRGTEVERASGEVLLTVDQPAANHNGGMIAFAPDGSLYIALGDGGASDDKFDNGRNTQSLLGTILRLDVSREGEGRPYAIPADNPYADGRFGAPEVWATGLRNPWRFTIDPGQTANETATIYIGDVGQNAFEEVDVVSLEPAGYDFGWSIKEGTRCFERSRYACDDEGLTDPVLDYRTADGACSVVAGVVYRGSDIPALQGTFLYSDFCAGFLRSFRYVDGQITDERDLTDEVGVRSQVTSFGTDVDGEVLLTQADGTILRLVTTG